MSLPHTTFSQTKASGNGHQKPQWFLCTVMQTNHEGRI